MIAINEILLVMAFTTVAILAIGLIGISYFIGYNRSPKGRRH